MQFFAYQNTHATTKTAYPYLLDIQSNLLSDLKTTVVVPLSLLKQGSQPLSRLNPTVKIARSEYIINTTQLASLPRKALGKEAANLTEHQHGIIAALDFLLSGI
ncbi:MAG: CcdB family protein [Formosimonas sp.]|jgi:toxin CcdB